MDCALGVAPYFRSRGIGIQVSPDCLERLPARCKLRARFISPRLVRLDAGKLEHLRPLLGFLADEANELGGWAIERGGSDRGEPCLQLGSASPALISLLSLSTMAAGVPLGAPMPYQPLAS